MTASITSGQKTQLERLAEDAARKGVGLALEKDGVGKFRAQQILESGDAVVGAVVGVVIEATRRQAPKRKLAPFASFYVGSANSTQVVALTPLDLGFKDQPFITQILDEQRLKEWSEDWLTGQRVELCDDLTVRVLQQQKTFLPGKVLHLTRSTDAFAGGLKTGVNLVCLDGKTGKTATVCFGHHFPITVDTLFVFHLRVT